MQHWPLLVSKLIDHAASEHGDREIVTLAPDGGLRRSDWRTVARRARALAHWLVAQGVKPGDRVATLAWNSDRHVELWYGIAGAGAVTHTVNPRLFREQIAYILNHAGDGILFLDPGFLPIVEGLAAELPAIRRFVVLESREAMPSSTLDLLCYEDILAAADEDFRWVEVDETAPAGLCYTSGTTGLPKGVLYTHRSNVLLSGAIGQVDMFAMSSRTTVLPVVPLYHANGWALPYACAMFGAKLVMAGARTDVETIQRLILDEQVTLTAAVPTIWQGMLQHLDRTGTRLGALERVVIGGSAVPRSMIEGFERRYGVTVVHAWGLTESSAMGTIGMPGAAWAAAPYERILDRKQKQGRAPFGVEITTQADDGRTCPRDGESAGHLKIRGPWVVDRYFGSDESAQDADGWFDTGDIASIDADGLVRITDRAKDVIKSGGEWISSIDLENVVAGCPGVAEAAVVAIPHPRWDERPLLVVKRAEGGTIDEAGIYAHLDGRIARWWRPDRIVFVDEIPHSATGKILKSALRDRFRAIGTGDAGPTTERPS